MAKGCESSGRIAREAAGRGDLGEAPAPAMLAAEGHVALAGRRDGGHPEEPRTPSARRSKRVPAWNSAGVPVRFRISYQRDRVAPAADGRSPAGVHLDGVGGPEAVDPRELVLRQ